MVEATAEPGAESVAEPSDERAARESAYRVTRAGAADIAHWRAVRLAMLLDSPRAFGSTYEQTVGQSDEQMRARLRATTTWIAWEGERPVGSVGMFQPDHVDGDETCLIGMWVAPPARGRGVGDLLIETVIGQARAEGRRRVVLDVAEENAPARAVYERHGFTPTGRTWLNPEHGGVAETELARDVDGT